MEKAKEEISRSMESMKKDKDNKLSTMRDDINDLISKAISKKTKEFESKEEPAPQPESPFEDSSYNNGIIANGPID